MCRVHGGRNVIGVKNWRVVKEIARERIKVTVGKRRQSFSIALIPIFRMLGA